MFIHYVKVPRRDFVNLSGDLIDVWRLLQPSETGETFKSSPLHRVHRADRILYRGVQYLRC